MVELICTRLNCWNGISHFCLPPLSSLLHRAFLSVSWYCLIPSPFSDDTLAAEPAQLRDAICRQVKCQADTIIDRKVHSCFCMFCCPGKLNSLSKIIWFLSKYPTSPSYLRIRVSWTHSMVIQESSFLPHLPCPLGLFILPFPSTHCVVQIFGTW